jgi:hypothetical protein
MKHIKRFNENTEAEQVSNNEYNPSKGRGDSYKENLSRGSNEFVYEVLPELEKLVGTEMSAIVKKISDQIRAGKLADSKNDFGRDYGLALGSMFYNLANKK